MIIRYEDAIIRKGSNIEIRNYITKEISNEFSLAVSTLDGIHPKTLNTSSERAYYIIEGEGIVTVGGETSQVTTGDTVLIPKNTTHSIEGTIKYLVLNSPPFDPLKEVKQ